MDDFAPYAPQTTMGPRLCDLLNYGIDLGLQDYPIYDEADRDRLNQAIVDHFYTREISAETPGMFVFQLNRQMREHMPQINQVWRALNENDPFTTSDMRSTASTEGTSTGTERSSADATARARTLNTNAPQVSMVGKDEMNYYDTGTGSENSSESATATERRDGNMSSSTGESTGRSGYLADVIASFYDGYNNTDLLVFDILEPCFSQIFSTPLAVY